MSVYVPQGFESGQILTAAQLNYIEDGISKILPMIEAGEQQLVTDENGNVVWESKTHGYIEEEKMLINTEIKGTKTQRIESTDFLASVLPEATFRILIDGQEKSFNVTNSGNNSSYSITFPEYQNLILMITDTFILIGFANKDNVTGSLTIYIKNKIYTKINPNYLPFSIREGEGLHSVRLCGEGVASGNNSVSILGRALGESSFAVNGTASTLGTVSLGGLSEAKGEYSVVTGYQTIANSNFSMTIGKANIEDVDKKYAFIIGNGILLSNGAADTRSNAYTLDWQGNGTFAGTVKSTGVILSSPNGSCYQITVGDDGQLNAAQITE